MDLFDPQLPAGGQISPAGLTRRAALGFAGVLGLSQHGLIDVAMSKKKRRRRKKKRSRSVPLQARFVRAWGNLGAGFSQFDDPKGIAVAPNGDVYVADDQNNRIQRFSAVGTFRDEFEVGGGSSRPLDVEVAADGTVFVTNRTSEDSSIELFSPNGQFLRAIGSDGTGDGQFGNLRGLALGANGDVYSSDHFPERIQQFGPAGNFIRSWGVAGSGDGEFDTLEAIAAAPNGEIYSVEEGNFRVQRFSASGEFLGKWGSQGSGPGQFEQPSGITVAPNGNVFVADAVLHRIQAFSPTGTFLGQFGTEGTGTGELFQPAGLAIAGNAVLYVVDGGNNRVQQFSVVQPAKKRKKNGKKRNR
jgi:tripartite motif-containing protein 71